jgi:hypothetical protein
MSMPLQTVPIVSSRSRLKIQTSQPVPVARALSESALRPGSTISPTSAQKQWFVTTAEMRSSASSVSLSVAGTTMRSASTSSLSGDAQTKARRSELAGEIGWQSSSPFRSQLESHARRPGADIGISSADHKSILFVGLSGDTHFERKSGKINSRIPTVNSTGHGYHSSAHMYKKDGSSIRTSRMYS